jgi:hypothetical protein
VASRWPYYEIGRRDYIFALGVLAANFNELEGTLQLQFTMHVRLPFEATTLLFNKSDNAQRIKIILGCLEGYPNYVNRKGLPYNEREKMLIRHFLRGFAICAENGNILLHAEAIPLGKKNRVFFYKDSRKPPHDSNRYAPSISTLRSIADSMRAFSDFGSDLFWVLRDAYWMEEELGLRNLRKPLPYRPRLPKPLVPQLSVSASRPKER